MESKTANECTLLACQVAVPLVRSVDDKFAHIDRVTEKADRHLQERRADMLVLPELSTIEYSRESFSLLSELAEPLDGPSAERMRALAIEHNTTVVFGMPRRESDEYFISQVVIGSDGNCLGCYDKLHVCQYGASMEKEYFQRGKKLCVFDIAGFRFAPIICYDIRIPELSRVLTIEHQVDCILHCGAYYRDESFATWHDFVITRAMENQLYFLSLNRAGDDYGNSVFCQPWIDETKPPQRFDQHAEDFRYFRLSRDNIEKTRRDYTFLGDTLPTYRSLPVEFSADFARLPD